MQISRITNMSVDESSSSPAQFEMSGTLSEWLFSTGFWRKFNEENGTMFDQFEEDEADATVVLKVVFALSGAITSVESYERDVFEFIFRRLSDGSALTASVTKENLLEELKSLRKFLGESAERKLTLMFSL